MSRLVALASILALNSTAVAQTTPSLRDVMDLEAVGAPQISPDGRHVLFRRYASDWKQDRRTSTVWLSTDGFAPEPVDPPGLGEGRFAFCGDRLAYLMRDGGEVRLRRTEPDGSNPGDFGPLPEGTGGFECDRDAGLVVVSVVEPPDSMVVREAELFGEHDVKDEAWRNTHLWTARLDEQATFRRLTSGDFTVGSFRISPDGASVAFDHTPDPRPNSSYGSDISVVDVASGRTRSVATNPGLDVDPVWAPDGSRLLFLSALDVAVSNLPLEIVVAGADGTEPRVLTAELATEPSVIAWNTRGIWFTADEGTRHHLYRMDPATTETRRIAGLPEIVASAALSADGATAALLVESRSMLPEIILTPLPGVQATKLTDITRQVAGWPLGTRELVRWRAADGLEIEGVLLRPEDFDPKRRYPLLVVVHGGPRAESRPELVYGGLYPVEQWVARGALVLMPNYRGSTGYGPQFRAAHHRTLGRGDAMDVLAGVDDLIGRGIVDPERVGLMGWSYGGFISAYLTATTDRFRAISVGAGISDWPTHYAWEPANITTLVFSFGVPPFEDPAAWSEASPMSHIAGASTPTLIQHVDGDPIVTVLNAYELYQALKNLDVEARFVEYHGDSHGPTGLKQRLGVLWHNQQWFARHIWGRDIALPAATTAADEVN